MPVETTLKTVNEDQASKNTDESPPGKETVNANYLSRWRAIWRKLSYCWRDPDADESTAAAYRVRQFQAVLQQGALSGLNCVFSLLITWLLWTEADHGLLLGWCAAVWAISGISLLIWHRYKAETESSRCEPAALIWTACTAVLALLFSVIPTYLFDAADLKGKLILLAITTGFVAHGALRNAYLPIAGILWSIGMCFGGAATMFYLYGDTYSYLAWLTIFYCFIVCISVFSESNLFVKNLMAETKIEQQKQLIGLLLHDFEDDASDWLWETDQHGKLRHASSRLAEVTGLSPGSLHGQALTSVLLGGDDLSTNEQTSGVNQLAACFSQSEAFRNIEVLFRNSLGERRWSVSGKPLCDTHGNVLGWRGVGSDITAERDLQASRETAAKVAGELDTARRIQMGLLPDLEAVMAGESRFSVAAILEPAFQVGGDYYECFALDENRFCFAVADVSGKGVPASLFMAMTKTLSASLARRSDDLGQAVSQRNRQRTGPQ